MDEASKVDWKWKDSSIAFGKERLTVWDRANTEGRYLKVKIFGKQNQKSIIVPFGKGGKGWSALAKALKDANSFRQPAAIYVKKKKDEASALWEEGSNYSG